jgi:hypothetical protein
VLLAAAPLLRKSEVAELIGLVTLTRTLSVSGAVYKIQTSLQDSANILYKPSAEQKTPDAPRYISPEIARLRGYSKFLVTYKLVELR